MRQVVMNSGGAVVARVPRPVVEPGSVLVRVHYSLISVGTELAPLKASLVPEADGASTVEKGAAYASLASRYFKASLRDPEKAARRIASIARQQMARLTPAPKPTLSKPVGLGEFSWTRNSAASLELKNGTLEIITDESPAHYQASSQDIAIPAGAVPVVRMQGIVHEGTVSIGILSETKDRWLGSRVFEAGRLEDYLIFDPGESRSMTIVISTAGAGRSRVTLETVDVTMSPALPGGLPASELDTTGWGVGYSAAGEVEAVGAGITDLAPGDLVACAGAGQANHADWINVKRNLVVRVPNGVPLSSAASTTIGAIALQGVRRATPQLGDIIAVVGLGLIGQITVQLLKANGCRVLGLDLDPQRVSRAQALGLTAGASDPETFKQLVRDHTKGYGADRTLLTAATRSDALINMAMDITRPKGAVIIVGDVGLNVQRAVFYRKEIDLLMSTSYGPGRYDPAYEVEGRDYPYGYVRWTQNRNMQAYLELIANGSLNIETLIDRVITIEEAPAGYRALLKEEGAPPLGVLIRYPDDTRDIPEPPAATRITIRGHKPPRPELINYALVGASAFGMAMLVPQMKKCRDRYFLRGVVSRTNPQGGNFARENGVAVLASSIDEVLKDDAFHLVVIATRHHDHADQVVRSLQAGKHVFVEKPLAITWQQLDSVIAAYEGLEHKPMLMVGFNRRFSPALKELAGHITARRAPLVIQYRLNGGYIPLDSWVHGPQGGGRNIGEACHMYDVFRSLIGAPVRAVSASSIDPRDRPYLKNDNFVATVSYADGSLATLTYTALGPKTGLGKERIEVFCDGETWVVDDFKKLIKGSDGSVLWQSAEPDKGHFEELSRMGDAIATGAPSPISFDEIVETTALALHVEDQLFGRYSSEATP
jgi:predicted dehydrogenase/threonine dehydrogenase-like Zn-dependent dehydrogenase